MRAMLVAAYILARAENGEFECNPRLLKALSLPPKSGPFSAGKLALLQKELGRWSGLGEHVPGTARLLWEAGLLLKDEKNLLRPSPSAFVWLQLPPSLACRLLFDAASTLLPPGLLTGFLAADRISAAANGNNRPGLESLAALGLAERLDYVEYQVGRGQEVRALLEQLALSADRESGAPDDREELELAYFWQEAYPGKAPPPGWLEWHNERFCFSLAYPPPPPSRLTFDPWQLYHLFGLCEPLPDQALPNFDGQLYLQPTQQRVVRAYLNNIGLKAMLERLGAGLNQALPSTILKNLEELVSQESSLRAREVLLLEAPNRRILERLANDWRVRACLGELLAPRYATIKPPSLTRLGNLLKRRGFFLNLAPPLSHSGPFGRSRLSFTLSRFQLGTVLASLIILRRQEVAMGYPTIELDGLISYLEDYLTSKEKQEADRIAATFDISAGNIETSEFRPGVTGGGKVSLNELRWKLEEALAEEKELLIEYFTPGKPPQQRWIEPLQLNEREEYIYLLAYCHLRREKRVFRLDRMRLLDPTNKDAQN